VGPIVQLPTNTNQTLSSNVWGLGPAAVVVKLAGPIVAGALVNSVFSLGGTSGPGGTQYSGFTFNPFFVHNLGKGWFVGQRPDHYCHLASSPKQGMDCACGHSGWPLDQDRGQAPGRSARWRLQ
jgi:hypothetical protein